MEGKKVGEGIMEEGKDKRFKREDAMVGKEPPAAQPQAQPQVQATTGERKGL